VCNVGDSSDEFTIKLHHGGFFVGYGELRSYVDGKIDWFDHVETDTWSLLWFEDFQEQLGYKIDKMLKIYWLLPGKTLADGLRIISGDHDINVMSSVAEKHKTLVVYFDHDDNIGGHDWDDVVVNPMSPLPKVISPHKVEYVRSKPGEKLPVFYTDIRNRRVEQNQQEESDHGSGSDSDSEYEDFEDSDYDLEAEDDDLFEEHVDDEVGEQVTAKGNKKERGSKLRTYCTSRPEVLLDEESEEDDLQLPDSDGEGESFRLKSFKDEDLNDVQKLREALTEYSVRNRVEIKMPRNDRKRLKGSLCTRMPMELVCFRG
jgi:hypothetical protein